MVVEEARGRFDKSSTSLVGRCLSSYFKAESQHDAYLKKKLGQSEQPSSGSCQHDTATAAPLELCAAAAAI